MNETVDKPVLEKPRFSFIHVIFFFLIFSFIIALWGFWGIETVLWNRVVYRIGQWEHASPIFQEKIDIFTGEILNPLEDLIEILNSNFLSLFIGTLALFTVGILSILRYFISRKWDNNVRLVFRFFVLLSFLMSFVGFWLYSSIGVIAELPSLNEGLSGYQWIREDLGSISVSFELFGLSCVVTFLVLFLVTIIILYINREKKIEIGKKARFDLHQFVLNSVKKTPFYLILFIYLIITLLPIVMTVLVSVSTKADLDAHRLPTQPFEAFIKNFSSVVFAIGEQEPAFTTAFIYSIILGLGTGTVGLAVSLSAGYSLARFKFSGNKLLSFMILSTQMFPGLILLIPQYVIWKELGFLERDLLLFGVLLAYISGAVAYCTWMMKGYFETIPIDLEEAALLDGAGQFGTFIKIAVPLAKPGMVAVLIFTFLTAWSEFVLARTFIGETDPLATLPLLFYNYQNMGAPDNPIFFQLLAPYAILVALPVVIFFLILQKDLAAGAVAGGVK